MSWKNGKEKDRLELYTNMIIVRGLRGEKAIPHGESGVMLLVEGKDKTEDNGSVVSGHLLLHEFEIRLINSILTTRRVI